MPPTPMWAVRSLPLGEAENANPGQSPPAANATLVFKKSRRSKLIFLRPFLKISAKPRKINSHQCNQGPSRWKARHPRIRCVTLVQILQQSRIRHPQSPFGFKRLDSFEHRDVGLWGFWGFEKLGRLRKMEICLTLPRLREMLVSIEVREELREIGVFRFDGRKIDEKVNDFPNRPHSIQSGQQLFGSVFGRWSWRVVSGTFPVSHDEYGGETPP
jgi:hypothetical protein